MSDVVTRRMAIVGAFGMAVTATTGRAQTPPQSDQLKPYMQVTPVGGEEKAVRVFFSPSCRFSRMYLSFFRNLEATLPPDRAFSMTALVNKSDGIAYAMAFAAVRRFYPTYLHNFIEASMVGVQDKGISTATWMGLNQIGRAAGLAKPLPLIVQAQLDQVQKDVKLAVRLRHDLAITNTPAVAVAGTYVVTPEFANGDARTFSQLVNGLISMAA